MGILTRYVLRSHAAPFFFSFFLLTCLLFINAMSRRLDELVGKGLPTEVILDTLLLALPHTVAVTLPMAVLVSVLYAYTSLGSGSEIIAMAASGVRPATLLAPTLLVGLLAATATYIFNDRVLPDMNNRLATLMLSIARQSPAFELDPGAVNRIQTVDGGGPYYLRADSIDNESSRLFNVLIVDLGEAGSRLTTYAQEGRLALDSTLSDARISLLSGENIRVDRTGLSLERTSFDRQVLMLSGVQREFTVEGGGRNRSEREMTGAMLREARDRWLVRRDSALAKSAENSVAFVREALHPDSVRIPLWMSGDGEGIGQDIALHSAFLTAQSATRDMEANKRRVNTFEVEIHKKFAIPFACIVFVLIGAPIAIRFPSGGTGLVITVTGIVLAFYDVTLRNGETMSDRGTLSPAIAMWTANAVFFALGLVMVTRTGHWIGSTRTTLFAQFREWWGGLWSRRARSEMDAIPPTGGAPRR